MMHRQVMDLPQRDVGPLTSVRTMSFWRAAQSSIRIRIVIARKGLWVNVRGLPNRSPPYIRQGTQTRLLTHSPARHHFGEAKEEALWH
jgi:hypothetical protein